MADLKYAAIDIFCSIIDGFSASMQQEALGFVCMSLAASPPPTGLEPTLDRPLKQLFWDPTTERLRSRMIELVEENGLQQSVVVMGAVGYLDWHFDRLSDREFTEDSRDNCIDLIASLQGDLKLPIERRNYKQSDGAIREFLDKLTDQVNGSEPRRVQAEEALSYLRERASSAFTWKLWHALHATQEPRLRNILGEEEENGYPENQPEE